MDYIIIFLLVFNIIIQFIDSDGLKKNQTKLSLNQSMILLNIKEINKRLKK